jgi:hypothetical protein
MGADHKFDLTSDVTHLIVGALDTSKYKYVAKERPDVKAVLPAFVDAVKESWMKGGATDVEALEREYRVPTLQGLIICITGIESRDVSPVPSDQPVLMVNRGARRDHRTRKTTRRAIPWRSDETSHTPHRCHSWRQKIRARTALGHQNCRAGMAD